MENRRILSLCQLTRGLLVALIAISSCWALPGNGAADEPAWIWSPQKSGIPGVKPQGECYFRKKFTLVGPQQAQLIFSAGDEYEIYLNGRLATLGQSFGEQITVDVSELIEPGVNLLAARIRHYGSQRVGLSLKFRVKEEGDARWRSLSSDDSWKTRISEIPNWNKNVYNDMAWIKAQVLRKALSDQEAVELQTKAVEVADSNKIKATPVSVSTLPPSSTAPTRQPETVPTNSDPIADAQPTSGLKAAATTEPSDQESPAVSPKNVVASASSVASEGEAQEEASAEIQTSPAVINLETKSESSAIGESSKETVGDVATQSKPDTESTVQSTPTRGSQAPSTLAATEASQAASSTTESGSTQRVVAAKERFVISPEFSVQQIMSHEETGSLIAMEFNEFGKVLLSREGGPLLIADVTKPVKHPARIRTYCNEVNTCQGILPLNGKVYVVANGPQGMGLYLLSDPDNDGTMNIESRLLSFTGGLGEHGPHGIVLGRDGMLYVILGNGSQLNRSLSSTSPLKTMIEGDLVPRFEDPGGHAAGVKTPGGTVIRVSLDGSRVERVAGGIRNAYDLAQDRNGELFIHDSDMESDIGTTWYRPTMLFHIPAGSELGWRSGWAKFPEYLIDQTPPVASTGRGSPTGATLYQHLQFPTRYRDSIFLADWSEGRILNYKPQIEGAGYGGEIETFLTGRPLNVCDLAVGEDGGLYFCTGGRGTNGGVFRITWNGEIPEEMLNFDSDLSKVLRHPQPDSAWARQNIAQIRIQMGAQWGPSLEGVARETRNTSRIRVRALQLMVFYGPAPSPELMIQLAGDQDREVRAQVARLCGLSSNDRLRQTLLTLVTDTDPYVRRVACESCLRRNIQPGLNALLPMLASEDRVEAQTARRMLEHMPTGAWANQVLEHEQLRVFINGSLTLCTVEPTLERSYAILARAAQTMDGFVNDRDFVDLLRTMQIALVQGKVEAGNVSGLAGRIVNEFPSSSSIINRELARLLGYLKAGGFDGRLESYLADSEVPNADKVHVAMYLIHAQESLQHDERLAVVNALETARKQPETGGSYLQYVQNAIEKVSGNVADKDIQTVLKNGHRWPKTVLAAFYKLPKNIDQATEQSVIELDQRLRAEGATDHAAGQVRLGVIAILARDGDQACMEYLRKIWQEEPERRNNIVIGLSQQPDGENWAYLISSLDSLDDLTSHEVIEKLSGVSRRPRDAKYYRQVIELGYRLRGKGAVAACKLIQHWSGEQIVQPEQGWEQQLQACRTWYRRQFPEAAKINAQQQQDSNGRFSVGQVVDQLEQRGLGNALHGQRVFTKAQCATCHHANDIGRAVGPELTNLASRFSLREVVESTINPSAVVPDRYATKTILTADGITVSGMTIRQPDGSLFVLQTDGERIRVAADDVVQVKSDTHSSMPEGLLDNLTSEEIADLFAFLMQQPAKTAQQAEASVR